MAPSGPSRHPQSWFCGILLAFTQSVTAQAQLRGTTQDEPPLPSPVYHIKPSEVTLPPGAKPGDVRRMIQPFADWTLICDENLKTRMRICNVAQTIVDKSGRMVFSWSLAATKAGAPVFILRAPVAGQSERTVVVDFGGGATPGVTSRVTLTTCDATLCIGFLPATPEIRRRIATGGAAQIQVAAAAGAPLMLRTTLEGLAAAIKSLK